MRKQSWIKAKWRQIRPYVISHLAYTLANLLGKTLKIETVGLDRVEELEGGKILAGWHGRIFLATQVFKNQGVWTIISHSRDGEMQKRIFTKFGYNTIRGSTGRGGARAAVESIKVLRKGAMMAFTPDGPRGPSGVIQNGMLAMAQKSGAAMIPVGVSAKDRWLVKSWDRWMVPKPFSQGIMIFGTPLYVPANASDDEIERIRQTFELEMHRLERLAEQLYGYPNPDWHSPESQAAKDS